MKKICVTGATGFVGRNLLNHLKDRDDLEIVALSRKLSPDMDGVQKGNVTWRRCNGFSLDETVRATRDCHILIYLIHSMLPSTSLTQGSFSDFDFYLADNFARAAGQNGIQRVIYLGGLIPEDGALSKHLKSRLEVEEVLSQYGAPSTTLRAGLIVGKDGSSFKILERLVKRLPISICPSWTLTKTQPIDLQDVLASLEYCIDHHKTLNKRYDVGGPDILSYKEMLLETAKTLGKKRYIYNVPVLSPQLSKLWVSKVTSTPKSLVYPLVDSLKHEMIVDKKEQLVIPNHTYTSFKESLEKGVCREEIGWIQGIIDYNQSINLSWLKNATSIQRVRLKTPVDAEKVSQAYFFWVPWFLLPLVRSSPTENSTSLYLCCMKDLCKLIELEKISNSDGTDVITYQVTGGLLSHEQPRNGRFEFRFVPGNNTLVIALLDFRPSLPWFVYKYSQARLHLYVMRNFCRYLKNIESQGYKKTRSWPMMKRVCR